MPALEQSVTLGTGRVLLLPLLWTSAWDAQMVVSFPAWGVGAPEGSVVTNRDEVP